MKILMLCPRLPYPLNKGEKIRAFHHLRFLARKHDVTLMSLVDSPEDLRHVPLLRELVGQVDVVPVAPWRATLRALSALASGRPMSVRYFSSPPFHRQLRSLLDRGEHDLIFVYSSSMAQYARGVRRVPVVADFVDMDSQKWLQYAQRSAFPLSALWRLEGRRVQEYERRVGDWADCVVFVSEAEASLFRGIAPAARTGVVPMVVDSDYFAPVVPPPTSAAPTLIFTGVMNYWPNVDAVEFFTREIFSRIRAMEPAARFLIVGQRPSRMVRRLAEASGVVVTGAVPDVRPYLAQAHVSVAPFRMAQGMQSKILEAMAMALPVVATPQACRGLDAEVGSDLFVESSPAAFARRVLDLLRDPVLRRSTGLRARGFVETHHGWEASMAHLDGLLNAAAERSSLPRPTRPR
jgi:sugar transferase (PEP-CTERM/EpsH1 system associated)